jgi:hypothetical protein
MKTSNIIFTLAIVLFIGMMISYNFQLKAAYSKGDFRSPYYGYSKLEFKNFDKIRVNAANALVVRVSAGTENAIYVKDDMTNRVKAKESGKILMIDTENEGINDSDGPVLIVCSSLKEITTDAIEVYTWNSKTKERLKKKAAVWNSGTFVTGFNQDSLNIHVNAYTYLTLEKSNVKKVTAVVGGKGDATLNLVDSKIGSSEINVQGGNHLKILNTEILQRKEILSDSSMITLSGRIVNQHIIKQ